MAAAARESHRSLTAERQLRSEQTAPTRDDDERSARSGSTCGGGKGVIGLAAIEADVGDLDMLFETYAEQEPQDRKAKELLRPSSSRVPSKTKGSMRKSSVTASAGSHTETAPRSPVERTTAPSTPVFVTREQKRDSGPKKKVAYAVPVDESVGSSGASLDSVDMDTTGQSVRRVSTRDRSQEMYKMHRKTQEKLQAMREARATDGCTFSPQLKSKQRGRVSKEDVASDHLYQDFQKQLEKREKLAQQHGEKHSFQPFFPTATSRLAAKTAVTTRETCRKRAQDRSKAITDAMYKDCTFVPDTNFTKALTSKILAAKGNQGSVMDRLYTSSETQAAVVKSREKERVAKELERCTFRPEMLSSSKRSLVHARADSGKGYERLFGLHGEILLSKEAKKQELVAKEEKECTFAPRLATRKRNPKKNRMASKSPTKAKAKSTPKVKEKTKGGQSSPPAKKKNEVASAFSNLPFAESASEEERETTEEEDEADEDSEGADKSSSDEGFGSGGGSVGSSIPGRPKRAPEKKAKPFHERLYTPKNRLEKRKARVDTECTFKPDLSHSKRSSPSSRAKSSFTPEESRVDVMYKDGKQKQAARSRCPRNDTDVLRAKAEEKEMALCTFQPERVSIKNGRFKADDREWELFHSLYARRGLRGEAVERVLQEQMKDYTFAPELKSRKTRIGRSWSPARQKTVYEELYDGADAQRVARTVSATQLQSQQCPFKPVMATRRRVSPLSLSSAGTPSPGGSVRDEGAASIDDPEECLSADVVLPSEQPDRELMITKRTALRKSRSKTVMAVRTGAAGGAGTVAKTTAKNSSDVSSTPAAPTSSAQKKPVSSSPKVPSAPASAPASAMATAPASPVTPPKESEKRTECGGTDAMMKDETKKGDAVAEKGGDEDAKNASASAGTKVSEAVKFHEERLASEKSSSPPPPPPPAPPLAVAIPAVPASAGVVAAGGADGSTSTKERGGSSEQTQTQSQSRPQHQQTPRPTGGRGGGAGYGEVSTEGLWSYPPLPPSSLSADFFEEADDDDDDDDEEDEASDEELDD